MKINIGFTQYSNNDFADKADQIIEALTGNPKFPTPQPTLANLGALLKTLRSAIASTGPGRAEAIREARVPLSESLVLLSQNLTATPGVTEADLATTGFALPQPRTKTGAAPSAPQNVRIKHGEQSGVVLPTCNAVTKGGIRVYEVEYTLDPVNGPWTNGGSFPNSRAIRIAGLQRAKDVWVRLRVIGTNGPSAWSDPATILVN